MAHKPTKVNTNLKKKKRVVNAKLNITSMMDMFTIILVFLLKSYSADGNLVTKAEGLKLPQSTIEKSIKMSLVLSISSAQLMVEDVVVEQTQTLMHQIRNQPGKYMIDNLYGDMFERSELAKQMEVDYGTEFKGEVTVQIDENVPFEILTRILYTCGQSGWSNMKLAVYQPAD